MRTMCLACGTPVDDDGSARSITCPNCGRSIRSRQFEMVVRDDVARFMRYGDDPDAGPDGVGHERGSQDPYWRGDRGTEGRTGRGVPMRRVYGRPGARREHGGIFGTFVTDLLRFGLVLWCIAFVIYFFIGHVVALGGAMAIVPNHIIEDGFVHTIGVFTPIAFGLVTLSGYSLVGYFLLICIAIIASTMITLREWRPFVSELREMSRMRRIVPRSTPMVLLHLFLIDVSLVILYNLAVLATGSAPAGPRDWDFENWEFLFLLANASVYEELATRVLFIGLPLAIVGARSGRYRGWRTLAGGTRLFDRPTLFLLALSSLIFGLAHVIYGWDMFKFPSALFSGLIFGYLYIEKGLHASIMLHFMIDYFGAVLFLGLPSGPTTGMIMVEGVLLLTAIPVGIYVAATYGVDLLRDVRARYARNSGRGASV